MHWSFAAGCIACFVALFALCTGHLQPAALAAQQHCSYYALALLWRWSGGGLALVCPLEDRLAMVCVRGCCTLEERAATAEVVVAT